MKHFPISELVDFLNSHNYFQFKLGLVYETRFSKEIAVLSRILLDLTRLEHDTFLTFTQNKILGKPVLLCVCFLRN